MAHWAKVKSGIVQKVIVAEAEFFDTFVDDSPGTWIQTSYNTRKGVHWEPNKTLVVASADQSKALRKNYAGTDHIYDEARDAFYEPQPHPSWTLNEDTCWWDPPIPSPDDDNVYERNETAYQADNSQGWDKVT